MNQSTFPQGRSLLPFKALTIATSLAVSMTLAAFDAQARAASPALNPKPTAAAKLAAPVATSGFAAQILPRVVVKSVAFDGSNSDPTGVTTCVENTSKVNAKGVKIGTSFRYIDTLNNATRTNDHFLGAHVDIEVPAGGVVCAATNFVGTEWQRELFRKCDVIDVRGGTRNAGNTAFLESSTITPSCTKRPRFDEAFPRGVASAPIIKVPPFNVPIVTPPKGPITPPPPPPAK